MTRSPNGGDGALELAAGDYRLTLAPGLGGSVARFEWRGEPLFRPTQGPGILDSACFPLVPFSNRIAFGRFAFAGRAVALAPNFPGSDHPHPLHGFGWLAPWTVVTVSATRAVLGHRHEAGQWPWAYEAEQDFLLSAAGLRHVLCLTNRSEEVMPAGLGFHPYFPRTADTVYLGLHRGEWRTSADGLPLRLSRRDRAIDWWEARPAGSRNVDTVYEEREGALRVSWPERRLTLRIAPCEPLIRTVVYTPPDADFLCVEPVTHATDAVNRGGEGAGMRLLRPGEVMSVEVTYAAAALE